MREAFPAEAITAEATGAAAEAIGAADMRVLVIGGGAAGMMAALTARQGRVGERMHSGV